MVDILPDMEVYDAVFSAMLQNGIKPHDTRPDFAKADLPLVYVGGVQTAEMGTKTSLNPEVSLTLAVWGGKQQRYEVARTTARLFNLLRSIRKTEHLNMALILDRTARMVEEDKQGELDLWSGILDVTFKIL